MGHFIISFPVHSRSDVVAGFFFFSIQVVQSVCGHCRSVVFYRNVIYTV
nr:MAG TPA: hypothetical protein [Bacteriophage sp.]